MYLGDAISTATDPNAPGTGSPGDALPEITVTPGTDNSGVIFLLALLAFSLYTGSRHA